MKSKEITAKLGSPDDLPSVDETRLSLRQNFSDQMRGYIAQVIARHADQLSPLMAERTAMVVAHREERHKLKTGQAKRWAEEAKARQDRFSKGLRGVLDWMRGKHKSIEARNIRDAMECADRDQAQRDQLITMQLRERRMQQERHRVLRDKQKEDRTILAREIATSLRRLEQNHQQDESQRRDRHRGFDLSR